MVKEHILGFDHPAGSPHLGVGPEHILETVNRLPR